MQLVVEHVPSLAAYWPGMALTHLDVPMLISDPQSAAEHVGHQPLPPAAMPPSLPAGQSVQEPEPVLEIFPQSQVMHVVAAAELYVPAGQTVHTPAPAADHSPAWHGEQLPAPTWLK
jgi:hypothetical protein